MAAKDRVETDRYRTSRLSMLARGLAWFSLAAACSLSAFSPALAEIQDWQTMLNQGFAAEKQGNYDTAEQCLKTAMAQSEGDETSHWRCVEELGYCYLEEGRYQDAERYLKEALKIEEGLFAVGPEHYRVGVTMGNLANLYTMEGRFADAEEMFKRALEAMSESVRMPQVEDRYLLNQARLAHMYVIEGKYAQAQELLKTVARKRASDPGQAVPERLAEILLDQSDLGMHTGQYAQALETANKAQSAYVELYGPENAQAVQCGIIAATCLFRQAKYSEAEERLANLSRHQSGLKDTIDTASALTNLAQLYTEQHRYSAAEPLLKRALSIAEKLAPHGWVMGRILRNCGNLYLDQGKYYEAERMFKRSLLLREDIFGEVHPEVAESLESLGRLYVQENKFRDAHDCLNQALSILQQTTGESSAEYAHVLASLGTMYARQRQFSGPETDETSIGSTFGGLGGLGGFRRKHREDGPETLLSQALSIRQKSLPETHPDIAANMNALASLYQEEGKYKDAETMYRQLLERDEKVLGKYDPAIATDLDNLARVLTAEQRADDAPALEKRAHEIEAKLPGASSMPAVIEDQVKGTIPATPLKDRWALCIGISNFKDPSINLRYAAKDATDFRNFLLGPGHFKPSHVQLLVDEHATRQSIIDNLSDGWLGKAVGPDDLVVVYISSHGSTSLNDYSGANFLVAYDTNKSTLPVTGIPMQWLNHFIIDQVHGARVVLVLDVCHSGVAADEGQKGREVGGEADDASGAGAKGMTFQSSFDVRKMSAGTGQIILCSSKPEQISWESREYPNSVFTRRLIEGLQLRGNSTTISQAYTWMSDQVQQEVMRDRGVVQTPVLKRAWSGPDLVPCSTD